MKAHNVSVAVIIDDGNQSIIEISQADIMDDSKVWVHPDQIPMLIAWLQRAAAQAAG